MYKIIGKSRNLIFFLMILVSITSKSTLAKAAGAEVATQSRREKWHAAVARNTFRSQNAKKNKVLPYNWKLRCRKMVRHCGAKPICKSKY